MLGYRIIYFLYHYNNRINKAIISGSLSPRHGASSGCGWKNGVPRYRYLRIYWISSCGQSAIGGPPVWVLGEVITTHLKKIAMLWNFHIFLGLGLILWYNLSNRKGTYLARGPRRRWEDNIKIDLQEMEWGGGHGLDWSGSEKGREAGSCECGNEPSG